MSIKFKKIISFYLLIQLMDYNSFSNIFYANQLFPIERITSNSLNGNRCGVDELVLPNAFSPNADGENDLYCLEGWETCVDTFEIFIFNRWGEIVFESRQSNFCWNGIYKGKYLESNVFVYVLKAKTKEGIEFKKSGNITLLR
jgi:gliding motility-associated-like protein